jgi:hypothetical protein
VKKNIERSIFYGRTWFLLGVKTADVTFAANEFMTGCNRQWRVKKIQLVFSRRSCCHVFFSAPVDHCRRATPSTIPASIFEPVAIFDQLVLYGETFFWKGTHCHFGRFKNFFGDHI